MLERIKLLEAGGDSKRQKKAVRAALQQKFRPEFLNRIDDIIVFDALNRGDMDKIFNIQLKRVRRLMSDRQLNIEVTDEARTSPL